MYDDVESFLEELDAKLDAYRSARIAFIKLSQRPDGDPRPTLTTWQRALDKITTTQNAVMDLITQGRLTAQPMHAEIDPATGERLKT